MMHKRREAKYWGDEKTNWEKLFKRVVTVWERNFKKIPHRENERKNWCERKRNSERERKGRLKRGTRVKWQERRLRRKVKRRKEKGLLKQTKMEIKQLWQQEEIDSYY